MHNNFASKFLSSGRGVPSEGACSPTFILTVCSECTFTPSVTPRPTNAAPSHAHAAFSPSFILTVCSQCTRTRTHSVTSRPTDAGAPRAHTVAESCAGADTFVALGVLHEAVANFYDPKGRAMQICISLPTFIEPKALTGSALNHPHPPELV